MTIQDILDDNDSHIRQKTLPRTILRTEDATLRDNIAEELRVRGCMQAASTDELDEHSHENTTLILVHNVGFFIAEETIIAADNDMTFESFDSGWLWRKVIDASAGNGKDRFTLTTDGIYVLTDGYMIDKITARASTTQTQKYGLTNGGEEIMLETELTANVRIAINVSIIAEGTALTIYFTGISASTEFVIYKSKL